MRPMILACALTSLTTAVGFGSLVTAHFPVVRQYGMYAAAGVLFAYVLSMSLVPVGLSMVRLPVGATAEAATRGGRLTDRLIGVAVALVTRRRRLAWVGTALVTLVAGFGVLLVDEDLRVTAELDPTHPASVSNRLIEETVGGALSGAVVLTSGPGAFADPGLLRVLDEISAYAESWRTEGGERLVSRTLSVTGFIKEAFSAYTGDPADYRIPDTRAAVLTLLDQVPRDRLRRVLSNDYGVAQLRFQMSDLGSAAWRELRAQIAPLLERRLADTGDVAFTFTGFFTYSQDVAAWMTRDLVTSLFLATGVIAILIIGLFRSIRIGLLSMVPNLFALLVLGGIIGYAGIELRPSTAIVFSICIGIAVDDTIHVLARFREELGRHEDYEDALIRAMYGTGRAVLFTTLLLLLGFGTMMFSDFTATRELGLLGGITVSAALIGDLFLLPLLLLSLRKRWTARVRQGGAAAKSGVRASAAGRGEGLP